MPDTGDEFAQSIVRNCLKLTRMLFNTSKSVTKSGYRKLSGNSNNKKAAKVQAKTMRKEMEQWYKKTIARDLANTPDAVNIGAYPGRNDPVIEFTTRKSDPAGQIMADWLDGAEIPYVNSCATVPPTSVFKVDEQQSDKALDILEDKAIPASKITDLSEGYIAVNSSDENKTADALKNNNIDFENKGSVEGLASFRVAEENLNNALSLIDGALIHEFTGIDEKRFPNIEELHKRANMDMPDMTHDRISDVASNADELRRNAEIQKRNPANADTMYDSKLDANEAAARYKTLYCYPRSDQELNNVLQTCAECGVACQHFDSYKSSNTEENVCHHVVSINESDLTQVLISEDKQTVDKLVSCLNEIDNGIMSRDNVISLLAVDAAAKANAKVDIPANREITANTVNTLTTEFQTINFDKEGTILTDRLDKAGIPYQTDIVKDATTGELGLMNITFAVENGSAVENIMEDLSNANITSLQQSRFSGLDKLRDDVQAFESGDISVVNNPDQSHTRVAEAQNYFQGENTFTKVVANNQADADLFADALCKNGILFECSGLTFNVSNNSLQQEGLQARVESFISNQLEGKTPSTSIITGEVSITSDLHKAPKSIKGVGQKIGPRQKVSTWLANAQKAALELSRNKSAEVAKKVTKGVNK